MSGNADIWGIVTIAWVAVVGVPYSLLTLGFVAGKVSLDDPRITWTAVAWTPGFVVVLIMANNSVAPDWGAIWSAAYPLFAFGMFKLWKRRRSIRFPAMSKDRAMKSGFVGVGLTASLSIIGEPLGFWLRDTVGLGQVALEFFADGWGLALSVLFVTFCAYSYVVADRSAGSPIK